MKRLSLFCFALIAFQLSNAQTTEEKPKEKKPPLFRLAGFDIGEEVSTNSDNGFEKKHVSGIAPTGLAFYGNKFHNGNFQLDAQESIVRGQYVGSDQLAANILFQIRNKKGNYSTHHLFSLGVGYKNESYFNGLSGSFFENKIYYTPAKDTLGWGVFNGHTVPITGRKDTGQLTQVQVDLSQVQLNIGYSYRIFPLERFSIQLNGAFNAGYTISGYLQAKNIVYERTLYTAPYVGWPGSVYTMLNTTEYTKRFGGGFNLRPSVGIALSWRLSKKIPVLKHINVFAEAHVGYQITKLKNCEAYSVAYTGTKFGITYLFGNYYKS